MVSSGVLKNILIVLTVILLLLFMVLYLFGKSEKRQCDQFSEIKLKEDLIEQVQEELYTFAERVAKLEAKDGKTKFVFHLEKLPHEIRKKLIGTVLDKNAKFQIKVSSSHEEAQKKYWIREFFIASSGDRLVFYRYDQAEGFSSKVICRD